VLSLQNELPVLLAPYLPGRGLRAIKNARGLDQWPALHLAGGALVYHLPKWESGRRNLCLRVRVRAAPARPLKLKFGPSA
jgi:hypothetical protein